MPFRRTRLFYPVNPKINGQLLASDGTAAAPSISFINSTNTGFFRQADDVIGLSIDGTERYRFNGAGTGLLFVQDNADDIGASGATRPRTLYLGTSLVLGTGGTINGTAGSELVINEPGANLDFRHETSGNISHIVIDAGTFGGVGQTSWGAAVLTTSYHALRRPALTAGTDLNYFDFNAAPSGAVTVPAGTAAIVATVNVEESNITATGTVSDAYTVRIAAAPTEGTRNGALWVDAGVSRFDDSILIGGTAINSGTNQLNVYNGTVPTAAAADSVTFYSTDDSAANTIPSFYCEGTGVIATAQADSTSSVRVKMRINGTVVTLLAI